MARNDTFFQYADRASTSVYKFRVGDDPTLFVWFDYGKGQGSLHTTATAGPYRVEEELADAPFSSLEELLGARGTSRAQWEKDLLGQFGERLAWRAS